MGPRGCSLVYCRKQTELEIICISDIEFAEACHNHHLEGKVFLEERRDVMAQYLDQEERATSIQTRPKWLQIMSSLEWLIIYDIIRKNIPELLLLSFCCFLLLYFVAFSVAFGAASWLCFLSLVVVASRPICTECWKWKSIRQIFKKLCFHFRRSSPRRSLLFSLNTFTIIPFSKSLHEVSVCV